MKHLILPGKQCRLLKVKLGVLLLLLNPLRPLLLRETLRLRWILLLIYRQTAVNWLNVPSWALHIHPMELLLELRRILWVCVLVPRRLPGGYERLLHLVRYGSI